MFLGTIKKPVSALTAIALIAAATADTLGQTPDIETAIQNAEIRMARFESSRKGVESAIDRVARLASRPTSTEVQDKDHRNSDPYEPARDLQWSARELIAFADSLPPEFAKLVEANKRYQAEIAGAAEIFRKAAAAWRQFAEEERRISGIEEIADDYLLTADIWSAYAKSVETQSSQPLSFAELEASLYYVSRVRIFLNRIATHKLPSNDPAERHAALENKVKVFVRRIDYFREELRDVRNDLVGRRQESRQLVTRLIAVNRGGTSGNNLAGRTSSGLDGSGASSKHTSTVQSVVRKLRGRNFAVGDTWTGTVKGPRGTFDLELAIQRVDEKDFEGTLNFQRSDTRRGGTTSTCVGQFSNGRIVIKHESSSGWGTVRAGTFHGILKGGVISGLHTEAGGLRSSFTLRR